MRLHPELSNAAGSYLGWVDESTTQGSPPTWRYQEGSSLDYVRQAGAQDLMQRQRALGGPFMRLTQEQQEALAGAAWAFSFRQLVGEAASATRTDVLVEDRNRQVLASLPTESDAVLPWGASDPARTRRRAAQSRLPAAGHHLGHCGQAPHHQATTKASRARLRAVWAALDARGDDTPPPSQPDTAA